MTVCGCGADHGAERRVAVNRWEHEKLTGTTLDGHPLLDCDGAGRHYGGTCCDGPCCDPPSADVLEALHEQQAYALGSERASRQVLAWRETEPERYRAEPPDPTAILDEPDVTSVGGVTADGAVLCADCGTVHPPLLAMFESLRYRPPDDWESVEIVSVGTDPAGNVVDVGVRFDGGPLTFLSPPYLERLGVIVTANVS